MVEQTSLGEIEAPTDEALGPTKEANLEGIQRFRQTLQTAREWVDSIPTPGVDAGDVLGGLSALSVAKEVLNSSLNLLETPYVGDVTVEDIARDTFNLGLATTGAAARAGSVGANAVSMFGARPGRGASREMHEQFAGLLQRSREAEKQGFSPDDIWRMTGMDRDPQGRWRYEIADWESSVNFVVMERLRMQDTRGRRFQASDGVPLSSVLEHPTLYDHWPDLGKVRVAVTHDPQYAGFFDRVNNQIYLNWDSLTGPNIRPGTARQVLLHETQHALQNLQSRPGGTHWKHANEQLKSSLASIRQMVNAQRERGQSITHEQQEAWYRLERSLAHLDEAAERFGPEKAAYYMHPGEVEARLVEAGLHNPRLSPHERARQMGLEHTWDVSEITFPSATPEQPRGRAFDRRETPPEAAAGDVLSFPQSPGGRLRDIQGAGVRTLEQGADAMPPANTNLPRELIETMVQSRQVEIKNRRETIRQAVGAGDDPSVWDVVRINQQSIDRLQQEIDSYAAILNPTDQP